MSLSGDSYCVVLLYDTPYIGVKYLNAPELEIAIGSMSIDKTPPELGTSI